MLVNTGGIKMELSNVNTLKNLNIDGVRELRVPIDVAQEVTKKNGFDEIYFSAGGKDYVAFGKGIDLKSLSKSLVPAKLKGLNIDIKYIDDEANTAAQGAKTALKSLTGKIVKGAGIIGGGFVGFLPVAIGNGLAFGGAAIGTLGVIGFIGGGALIGGALAVGVTAGVGAAIGTFKGTDMATIDKVTK